MNGGEKAKATVRTLTLVKLYSDVGCMQGQYRGVELKKIKNYSVNLVKLHFDVPITDCFHGFHCVQYLIFIKYLEAIMLI